MAGLPSSVSGRMAESPPPPGGESRTTQNTPKQQDRDNISKV